MLLLFPLGVFAYTTEEVGEHNTESDCWVIFEDSVYDLTEYMPNHDKFMDIREWCGQDMTEDFKDKAGVGRDHREGSYELLESYVVGEVDIVEETEEDVNEEVVVTGTEETKGYNIVIPVVVTMFSYWIFYFLANKNILGLSITKFNAFWNTILFLTLLIPALGFGLFMMIRLQKPELWDIDFDFMYWHVELSLVMGIVALNHFVQRLKIYFSQFRA